jgi:hypothetical protein
MLLIAKRKCSDSRKGNKRTDSVSNSNSGSNESDDSDNEIVEWKW